ncbi:MAG: hypothetical protein LBU00_06710, partial [Treponema sp.]|nr:hypothetical protein [Treponema sp.]
MSFLRVLAWVPLVILLFSCVKADPASRGQPGPAGAAQAGDSPALELAAELAAGQALGGPGFPPEALLALLRPAASPLWFEVSTSPEAPRHIPSPAESELVPFTPWPLAPHVAATLVAGGALYLAVNRDSLLV